jgi:hypothetical protein
VPVGDVVGDDVDDGADAERQRIPDQPLRLIERAEARVDRGVVGDVVAAVGKWRRVPGREPDGVDSEILQIAETGSDAGEIAHSVTVPVREAAGVDLIDRCAAPPRGVIRRRRGPVGGGWLFDGRRRMHAHGIGNGKVH